MNKSFKKLTAIVLALMLTLSMCATGLTVSAAEETAFTELCYVVAGTEALTGYEWVGNAELAPENVMEQDGDVYTLTFEDVAVGNDYMLKVAGNTDADTGDVNDLLNWYGINGTDLNITFNVTAVCDVTVTFDPATKDITVTGTGVEFVDSIDIDYVNTVGNGDGTWLNGVNWDPADRDNEMTEVAPGVYEITYEDIEAFDNYQVKFAVNGTWACNWGGVFEGFGVVSPAVFDSRDNITIDTETLGVDTCSITLTLDLTNFDYTTKQGATFKVDTDAPKGTTIKFAAPTSTAAARYSWKNPVFFYGNNGSASTVSKNTVIPMTATNDAYYTAETGSCTYITAGSWTIYSVTLNEEQAAAVDAAAYVGFATSDFVNYTRLASKVTKAGVDTYDATYAQAKSIKDLADYTFVIKDTSKAGSISYMGKWVTEITNVRFAAPASPTAYSTWEDIDLYYATAKDTFATASKIKMVNTYETTKVSDVGDMTTLKAGRWYIYAVSLDPEQTAAVNASAKVGFAKSGAENKTSFSKSVLLAKTNTYDGTYNTTARTLQELDGQLFVVKGRATASSLLTFLGEWQTEARYTEGKDDTIKIRFAVPQGKTAVSDWDTGVELYYGNTTNANDCTKVTMTPVNMTTNVEVPAKLTTLVSGNWAVYEAELTVAQISAIDHSKNVGFMKSGSYNKTAIRETKSICRASKTEGVTTYAAVSATIEAYDGYTFVINDCLDTANERVSYLGSWLDIK